MIEIGLAQDDASKVASGFGVCVIDIKWILRHIPYDSARLMLERLHIFVRARWRLDHAVTFIVHSFNGSLGPFSEALDLTHTIEGQESIQQGSVAFLQNLWSKLTPVLGWSGRSGPSQTLSAPDMSVFLPIEWQVWVTDCST